MIFFGISGQIKLLTVIIIIILLLLKILSCEMITSILRLLNVAKIKKINGVFVNCRYCKCIIYHLALKSITKEKKSLKIIIISIQLSNSLHPFTASC